MTINYQIGARYKYPNYRKVYILKEVNGFIFRFQCGHYCTDLVFQDLINMETGIQVYQDNQLQLFI